MSITAAAEDLFLTQSAVSRQVQALERALEAPLFVRGHRSIAFTPEGRRLFAAADAALRELQQAMAGLREVRERRPVSLTAPTGFAGLWLLPRMGRLQERHPDIDLWISANNRMVDLEREGVDLAVRYCPARAAPEGAVRLFGETIAPVAHPTLLGGPLERPEQIAECFLLEFDDLRPRHLHWDEWLAAMGWRGAQPKGIVRFNQYDQVIQAALAGQGLALGRLELLGPMLDKQRLVALAPPRRLPEEAYAHWLVQADAAPRKDVAEVVRWLRSQAARTSRAHPGVARKSAARPAAPASSRGITGV